MTDPRDEFRPYWPQTIAPFGMPQPSWLPSAPPTQPGIDHLEAAKYWGRLPDDADGQQPIPSGGLLSSLAEYPLPGAPPAGGILGSLGLRKDPWPAPPPPSPSRNRFDPYDLANSFGIGVAHGAIGLPGMFGDARELFANGARRLADYIAPGYGPAVGNAVSYGMRLVPNMGGPTSAQMQGLIEPVTGKFYEPQTVTGDYLRTAGEFVPGIFAPGGVAKNTVRYVVAPALASEYAGQRTQGSWMEPWARAIAALATGGVGAALEHLPGALRVRPGPEPMPRFTETKPTSRGTELNTPSAGSRTAPSFASQPDDGILHPAPSKRARPFSADYPAGAAADASGRLLADMHGRPLRAEYIAGRRTAGGRDVGLTPMEIWDLIKRLIGKYAEEYPSRDLEGKTGEYLPRHDLQGNPVQPQIAINAEIPPEQKVFALGHETGHALHDLANRFSLSSFHALEPQAERVYSTVNTGRERLRRPKLPQDFGYSDSEAPYELAAEVFRSYLSNPNYLKTVAPDLAAWVRSLVNSHPQLSRFIQFNGLGGLGVLGAAGDGAGQQGIDHLNVERSNRGSQFQ
jgi:hypothetical protein